MGCIEIFTRGLPETSEKETSSLRRVRKGLQNPSERGFMEPDTSVGVKPPA